MKITTILFDLDGTLLPMNQENFIKGYFKLLAEKMASHGYDPQTIAQNVWIATKEMVKNNGLTNNETAFWKKFEEIYGPRVVSDRKIFDEFYSNEFSKIKELCGTNPIIPKVVYQIKNMGYNIALATNPVFPKVATVSRIRWAGFKPSDFEIYTTYENIGYCKPNPEYYAEVAKRLGVPTNQCLMVGNDVTEDMVAEKTGMQVFLLTDNIANKENKDISQYNKGNFEDLLEYIKSI